jgi:hypothetical protein
LADQAHAEKGFAINSVNHHLIEAKMIESCITNKIMQKKDLLLKT